MKCKSVFSFLLIIVLTASLFAGCGGAQQPATPAPAPATTESNASESQENEAPPSQPLDPIKIGYVGAITGENAILAEYESKGVMLAVDEINAAGGVNGHPLELVIEDAAGTNSGAVLATQKIIARDDIVGIIGLMRSPFMMAATEYIQEAKIPILTNGTALQITRHGNPYVFRIRANDLVVTDVVLKFIADDLGLTKIAVLHDTDVYGMGGLENIKTNLEKYPNLEIVSEQGYNTGARDWSPQLLNIRNSGAEVIIGWGTNTQENATIVRQIKQMGLDVKVIGAPTYGTTVMLESAGEYAEGLCSVTDWNTSLTDERSAKFIQDFHAKYGHDPDYASAAGYDGLYLLAEAIKNAGTDREAVRDAMSDIRNFEGIIATYDYDEFGDGNREMCITQVNGGRYEIITRVRVEK